MCARAYICFIVAMMVSSCRGIFPFMMNGVCGFVCVCVLLSGPLLCVHSVSAPSMTVFVGRNKQNAHGVFLRSLCFLGG